MRCNKTVVLFLILSITTQYSCNITEGCDNQIYARINSGDNKLKVIKFGRDCGATTKISIQLSLIKFTDSLPNETGNIFICDSQNDTSVRALWVNTSTILVSYDKDLKIFKKDSLVNNIKILYSTK